MTGVPELYSLFICLSGLRFLNHYNQDLCSTPPPEPEHANAAPASAGSELPEGPGRRQAGSWKAAHEIHQPSSLRARAVPSSAASFSGYGGRASSRSRSVNVCRTLGADLVHFGASSRALFCTILPSAFFARMQKAPCLLGFFWCCR